jgi:hypothetical protein
LFLREAVRNRQERSCSCGKQSAIRRNFLNFAGSSLQLVTTETSN